MKTRASKIDITQVKVGMIWYEENAFSFDRLPDKKIKAVVELVKDGVIYGDLTASELIEVKEECLSWSRAKSYICNLRYPCKRDEKIVNYDLSLAYYASAEYAAVENSFKLIGKEARRGMYWTADCRDEYYGYTVGFCFANIQAVAYKRSDFRVRPVLALKVE